MAESKLKKKSGLGRGLGALLDNDADKEKKISGLSTTLNGTINEVEISKIETNPWQPRSDFDEDALNDLTESIKTQGIIQPITIRAFSENKFQLISGERRLQASKKAGLKTIPAYIRTVGDQQILEMALIENIQRENLNAIEIAVSFQRLLTECDLKQEELGTRVGKKRSTITNYLRLLKLPPSIQTALRSGKMSMGHARALISMDDIALRLEIFQQIIKNDLSVRQTEELVRDTGKKTKKKTKSIPKQNSEINKIQTQLSSHFGSKIQIKTNDQNKGEIKIPFTSSEDFNRIMGILNV